MEQSKSEEGEFSADVNFDFRVLDQQGLSPIRSSCSSGGCSPVPRRLWTNSHGSTSEANEELPAGTRKYFSSPGSLREVPTFSRPKRIRMHRSPQGDLKCLPKDKSWLRLRPGELPTHKACITPHLVKMCKFSARLDVQLRVASGQFRWHMDVQVRIQDWRRLGFARFRWPGQKAKRSFV